MSKFIKKKKKDSKLKKINRNTKQWMTGWNKTIKTALQKRIHFVKLMSTYKIVNQKIDEVNLIPHRSIK